jgi:hypothetical protein
MFFGMLQFISLKIFGDIGLKPTLASKQESKDKAAKVNLANIVQINYSGIDFLFLQFSFGHRLNRPVVR